MRVLPLPDSPTRARSSPRVREKSTPATGRSAGAPLRAGGKWTERLRTSSTGGSAGRRDATGRGLVYALGQAAHQEVVIHSVEKLLEVEVHDIPVTARQMCLGGGDRLMC